MITKIISGGQTGADQAALLTAHLLHIPTGGTAPKGWRTEAGPEPALATYGLVQSVSSNYRVRTEANVRDSDGTVLFSRRPGSPGSAQTVDACERQAKPYIINPTASELVAWCRDHQISVLNVAGNRASKAPKIFCRVEAVLTAAFGPTQP